MPARLAYTIEEINVRKPADSRLTAISYDGHRINPCGKKQRKVACLCICGKSTSNVITDVVKGISKSCGCLASEETKKRSTKFFPVVRAIRNTWNAMLNRCYYKEGSSYKDYGAKGVQVCEEWRNDYQKFLDWSIENGWAAGLQLDKDIKGDGKFYSPETCLWVTATENANNTSRNKKYLYDEGQYTISQIARMANIPVKLLHRRVNYYKMDIMKAVDKPIRNHFTRPKKAA